MKKYSYNDTKCRINKQIPRSSVHTRTHRRTDTRGRFVHIRIKFRAEKTTTKAIQQTQPHLHHAADMSGRWYVMIKIYISSSHTLYRLCLFVCTHYTLRVHLHTWTFSETLERIYSFFSYSCSSFSHWFGYTFNTIE